VFTGWRDLSGVGIVAGRRKLERKVPSIAIEVKKRHCGEMKCGYAEAITRFNMRNFDFLIDALCLP